MQVQFFYAVVLSFISAVAVGTVTPVKPAYYLFLFLLGTALCVVTLLYRKSSSRVAVTAVAVGLIFSGLGLWRADLAVSQYAQSPLHTQVGQEVALEGIVTREPDVRLNNIQLYVEVTKTNDIVLVSVDRFSEVAYGDTVSATGKLEVPEAFVTDFGRTFLYPEYLKAKGVQFRISFAQVEVLESGDGNPVVASLLTFKQAFVDKLGTVLSEPQSGLGVGLLLGVKRALGEELEEAFRKTGIIHVVVLSGYNVMLVVAFVLFILGIFLPFTARAVFGIVAILLFALLVGLSPTVVRASIMAVLVLLAPLLGRRYDLMRALLLAGCGMIMFNPYILLYDVGFQLSFLATLGLILVAPQFEMLLMQAPNTLKVREFFIATLATQIAVAPLLLYQIGQLSLIALVVNVLVLPMVGVAMFLTFITGVLAFLSVSLANIVAVPAHLSLLYIIECARFFAGVPYASVSAPPFSVYLMVLMYGVMGAAWYFVTHRNEPTGDRSHQSPNQVAKTNIKDGDIFIQEWELVSEEDFATHLQNGKGELGARRVAVEAKASTATKSKPATDEVPIFFR